MYRPHRVGAFVQTLPFCIAVKLHPTEIRPLRNCGRIAKNSNPCGNFRDFFTARLFSKFVYPGTPSCGTYPMPALARHLGARGAPWEPWGWGSSWGGIKISGHLRWLIFYLFVSGAFVFYFHFSYVSDVTQIIHLHQKTKATQLTRRRVLGQLSAEICTIPRGLF